MRTNRRGKRHTFPDQTSVKSDDLEEMADLIEPIKLGKRIEKVFHASGYTHMRFEFSESSGNGNFDIFLGNLTGAILYNKALQ